MSAAGKGSRPGYTSSQRDAILSRGHTLLEAGAGSGKTTTLVGKILHALGDAVFDGEPRDAAEPTCELSEIAAITFTTAAAADLRRSLRARLRETAARDGADRRWSRLVYEVDRARIGTIHGFCGDLLRESALRAGLDPAFAVLDAAESMALRDDAARARVYEALQADDPDVNALADLLGPSGVVDAVRLAVESGDAAALAAEAWCADGRACARRLRASVVAAGGAWHDHDGAGADMAAAVLRLAAGARADVDEALDRLGALDYDALIYRTRDLLRRDPAVLAAARRRLRWLFIDEFQDTDPAQRDIAYLLCGIPEALAAGAATPGCPSLCIVGDPKQSIYGFRRADVTLWTEVARDFASLGTRPIPLDENFRSRAPLVGLVNAAFGAIMPAPDDEAAPAHEVRYRALRASRDFAGDDGVVEIMALPTDGKAEERRTAEAARIAARIVAMVNGREPVVWDGRAAPAPARWSDVALLFRARGDVGLYEAALRRAGIPCFVASGDGFHGAREVRDLVLLLRALADEHDDLAWLGLLRSPLVGLSDDAIYRVRATDPDAPLSRATLDPAAYSLGVDDAAALAFAARWLGELRRLRDRVPCGALLERAVERSGYAAVLLRAPGGDGALANVHKLVRMADGRPDASVAGFVAYLAERSAAREAEAPLHTAGENVVTLTTIHGAKGLEWPVVFLCDLGREFGGGNRAPHVYFDAALGIGVNYAAPGADGVEVTCGAYALLRAAAEAREQAENRRVLYVAATRARDRLVLCAPLVADAARAPDEAPSDGEPAADAGGKEPKRPKETAATWLLAPFAIDGERAAYSHDGRSWSARVHADAPADVPAGVPDEAPIAGDGADAPHDGWSVPARVRALPAPFPLLRRSATELMAFDKDAAGHRRTYLLGLRPPPRATAGDAGGNGGPTATALDARTIGDIVHVVLEHEDVARDLDALLERELVARLGAAGRAALAPGSYDRLRRLIAGAHAHPTVSRLTSADGAERELPFTWFVDVDGHAHVLHGAMDLVARVDGMVEVLDFKTHRLASGEEAAAAADYVGQCDLYAAALGELLGDPAAFTFFFPETGGEVVTPLGMAAVAEARGRLVERLRTVGAHG